ncbi:LysM peptidoglycan-binding domain-containing protein [Arthrobacter rhombi]|uniref:LysM peptidoglycan-binding domain-containing protein n=1 Tax=Arthrobacter rhombi TaxID=71253 RepID=UPI0031DCC9F6
MSTTTARGSAVAAALPGVLVAACGSLLTACGFILSAGHPLDASGTELSPAGLDRGTALVFAALGLAVLAWWLFCLLAGVASEVLRRHGLHHAAASTARCTPAFMRRLAAVLLGAHLLVVPAAQASQFGITEFSAPGASPTAPASWSLPAVGAELPGASWNSSDLPSPAWSPKRPAAPMNRLMGQHQRAASAADSIVVQEGDSLWSIAAREAGAGATDAEIARNWPRWYRTNRAAIGPDPDVLQIGTVLAPPRAQQDENRR